MAGPLCPWADELASPLTDLAAGKPELLNIGLHEGRQLTSWEKEAMDAGQFISTARVVLAKGTRRLTSAPFALAPSSPRNLICPSTPPR